MEPSIQSSPTCPYCHGSLVAGFLGVFTGGMLRDARWFDPGKSALEVGLPLGLGGGETVAAGGAGSVTIPGYRCTRCRVMFLNY